MAQHHYGESMIGGVYHDDVIVTILQHLPPPLRTNAFHDDKRPKHVYVVMNRRAKQEG